MTTLRMDIDRAVEIARDPHGATSRQRRDAFFWAANRLTNDRADDLTHIERRSLREVRERLTNFKAADSLLAYRPTRADAPDLVMVAVATGFFVALGAWIFGGFL